MLNAYPKDHAKDHAKGSALADRSWIDLVDPSEEERSAWKRPLGCECRAR